MQNNSTWTPSAPSPIVWPVNSWDAILSIVVAIGGLSTLLISGVVYGIVAVLLGQIDRAHPMANLDPLVAAQIVAYVPTAIYFAGLTPRLAHVSLRDLGFRAPTRRDVATALVGTVVMYVVVTVIGLSAAALTHRHDTETAIDLFKKLSSPGERIALVIMACVLAPLVEEIIFRVFLFNALTKYASIPIAALASGLIFGAFHMQGIETFLTFAVPLGAGGVVLAYVYASTRCYWANVITHATFNAISVFAILVFHAS